MKLDKPFFYFAFAIVLWGAFYVIYRAVSLSLVHDESLSYNITQLKDASNWARDANNHWLNTTLMRFCAAILGNAEWVLRLPNLLSYFCYAYFVFLICSRFKTVLLKYTTFLILFLNPFLLDFFSLARGYGLAIGLMSASLYFLLKMVEDSRNNKILLGFGVFSILTVLANSVLLIFYLSAMGIWAILLFKAHGLAFLRQRMVVATLVIHGYTLKKVLEFIFYLKSIHGLYAGGRDSFMKDVISSNLTTFFYNENSPFLKIVPQISFCISLIFGILGIFLFFNWILNRKLAQKEILFCLLAICVLIPMVQFHVLDVLFPTERGAVFYYPICIIALFSSLDAIPNKMIIGLITMPLSLFALFNFVQTANFTHCYTWAYERHTKYFLNEVIALHANKRLPEKVLLGVHWKYQPAIEHYYRHRWHLDWLFPVEREFVGIKKADIYYIEAHELPLVTQLDTATVLFKAFKENKSLILTK